MTERQIRQYYDQAMLRDERRWVRDIRKMFAQQLRDLRDLIKRTQSPQAIIEELPKVINAEGTLALYQRLYQAQGEKYYTTTQESLKGDKTAAIRLISKTYQQKKLDPNDPYFTHMAALVESKVGYRVRTIQQTSREFAIRAIQAATEQIQAEGLGIVEGANLIETTVRQEWRRTAGFRAARIARTEVGTLSNMASDLGAQNTGLEYTKKWLAFIDDRTRLSHAEANGMEVAKGQPFNLAGAELMHPSDPGAPPEEVINCRCVLQYIAPEFTVE